MDPVEAITQSEWWHTIKGGRHHRAGSVIIGVAGIVFFLNLEIWYLATTHGGKNTWWMIKYPHIKKNAQQKNYPCVPGLSKYHNAVTITSMDLWCVGLCDVHIHTGSYSHDH